MNLDDLPFPFTAISYVWGDTTPKDKAWFDDGTHLNITTSAGAVLRSIIKYPTDRYFWIDVLCIYVDRYQSKYYTNLKFGPLFSGGVRFVRRINISPFIHRRLALSSIVILSVFRSVELAEVL